MNSKDYLFQEKDNTLEIEIADWDLVESLNEDKRELLKDIELILKRNFSTDVEAECIDQLNPDLPIVSALFTIKE